MGGSSAAGTWRTRGSSWRRRARQGPRRPWRRWALHPPRVATAPGWLGASACSAAPSAAVSAYAPERRPPWHASPRCCSWACGWRSAGRSSLRPSRALCRRGRFSSSTSAVSASAAGGTALTPLWVPSPLSCGAGRAQRRGPGWAGGRYTCWSMMTSTFIGASLGSGGTSELGGCWLTRQTSAVRSSPSPSQLEAASTAVPTRASAWWFS
mmetsp:Transcript_22155/g.61329  ORF Transcript_22155/g.61329 Transcript_22155/m.61329 type:complete len:210 (-) Transcript_22155:460-1089(-)